MQVKVQHHDHQPKQQYKKWKRSVDGEVSEVSDAGGEVSEVEELGDIDTSEEDVEGEVVATDGSVRKERSLHALSLAAGAVVGGHIGKKLGLAIGLGARKEKKKKPVHIKKKKPHPVHTKKAYVAPKVTHHGHQKGHFKTEQVCQNVPFKQCTSKQTCQQVPKQRCVSIPRPVCVNVSICVL